MDIKDESPAAGGSGRSVAERNPLLKKVSIFDYKPNMRLLQEQVFAKEGHNFGKLQSPQQPS